MPLRDIKNQPPQPDGFKYRLIVADNTAGERISCILCHRLLHPRHNGGEDQLLWERFSSFDSGGETLWMGDGYVCTVCKPS